MRRVGVLERGVRWYGRGRDATGCAVLWQLAISRHWHVSTFQSLLGDTVGARTPCSTINMQPLVGTRFANARPLRAQRCIPL